MELPLRYILTVSELTQQIKGVLEDRFSDVWVEGEISNLRLPPSQHIYFTLKDDFSQVRAVLFRTQARALRFGPKDGLHVVCKGRVSLYEKRGDYQLILESVEPKGIGALQLAFLQLRERLEKEGLFDPTRKKPIPMVPQRIGIITSPAGAVIRDMLHILERRFRNLHVILYPVRVQGEEASSEIAEAVDYFNRSMDVDVIIVGRGGGSIEDLWPFNEERVARAIYRSGIPVISAVGHETDYTIADFVADLRAPTPSAAAELVVRDRREIENTLHYLEDRLKSQILQTLQEYEVHLSHLIKIFREPGKKIEQYFLRFDDLVNRLQFFATWTLKRKNEECLHLGESLFLRSPVQRVKRLQSAVSEARRRLLQGTRFSVEIQRQRVAAILGKLDSLSPLAILQRGYSITRKLPSLQILREARHVTEGDRVEVRLHRGTLLCGVEKTQKT
ncbi:MAG TPA: exodeoxyribonuclease VII large subunit [Thermodesulfobacteriota bacterium]|nr:exodeoxyribonuclease VII large subunit [Thermodesulfobacteriota bacterium]